MCEYNLPVEYVEGGRKKQSVKMKSNRYSEEICGRLDINCAHSNGKQGCYAYQLTHQDIEGIIMPCSLFLYYKFMNSFFKIFENSYI